MDQIDWQVVFSIVEKLTVVLAIWLMSKSIPADKVRDLFESLDKAAKSTQSPADDLAVIIGRMVLGISDIPDAQAEGVDRALAVSNKLHTRKGTKAPEFSLSDSETPPDEDGPHA